MSGKYLNEMEPMLPPDSIKELEDLAIDLTAKANALASKLSAPVKLEIGSLVRSMNCYYSNLIEGHNTLPKDIERALANDYSTDAKKRNLQLEAASHIKVQKQIDSKESDLSPYSPEYIKWIHKEFCSLLPKEMLIVSDPETKKEIRVTPGEFRTSGVQVGGHIPPRAEQLEQFLARFYEAYNPEKQSKLRRIIAIAAAHHRLMWIHPFYDGNGRVGRLLAHSWLLDAGVGSSLWSVSRGLARSVSNYKSLLMQADLPRINNYDGRGCLSQSALTEFCKYFLTTCVDQIDFMDSLLEPEGLLSRVERHVSDEVKKGTLPRGSFAILRHALLSGEFARSKAMEITGYKERQARTVITKLIKAGLLTSDTVRGKLRVAFPIDIAESWFPKLFVQL